MKKVVNISIGSVVFTIEEDAYAKLSEYLAAIKEHFKDSEVVNDIELSIAEKLVALDKDMKKVVSFENVSLIISNMGSIEDFDDETDSEEAESTVHRKLYRNTDDKVIAGVASGIGEYFSVDPVFIRLGFFVSVFLNGLGVIAYIALWIIMPAARTAGQKLQMKGRAITLEHLEKMAKEALPKDTSNIKKVVSGPFQFIGTLFEYLGAFLKKVFPFLGKAIGFALLLVSALAIAALTFTSAALLGMFDITLLWDEPIAEFLTGQQLTLATLTLYFFCLVPLLAILSAGSSLLSGKNAFTVKFVTTLLVIWFVSVAVGGYSISRSIVPYKDYINSFTITTEVSDIDISVEVE